MCSGALFDPYGPGPRTRKDASTYTAKTLETYFYPESTIGSQDLKCPTLSPPQARLTAAVERAARAVAAKTPADEPFLPDAGAWKDVETRCARVTETS